MKGILPFLLVVIGLIFIFVYVAGGKGASFLKTDFGGLFGEGGVFSQGIPLGVGTGEKPGGGSGGGTPSPAGSGSGSGGTPPPPPSQKPPSLIAPSDVPEGFTVDQLSPHFKKVRFNSISPTSGFNSYSRIAITGQAEGVDKINVTGWLIQANRGSQRVPQAVDVYDPNGLTAMTDIYLGNGDTLYISSAFSAAYKNFRLNKCTGYLENFYHFTPPLPRSCPSLDTAEVRRFSGACQDYVRSLGTCGLPAANPPVPEYDTACRRFIDTINYRGCFDRHRGDADFLSREWWTWTGHRFLDERHDRVLLLDNQGLLVDIREY
jgi:hypothetical protein